MPTETTPYDIAQIGRKFAVEGEFVDCERYTGGHINDTYFARYAAGRTVRRYVHQKINTHVFRDATALAHNIARVTQHVRRKLLERGAPDVERRVLRVIPTADGDDLLRTPEGAHWRTYAFIDDTITRVHAETARDAYAAAKAFGEFAAMLADFRTSDLRETIPGFHDTPARWEALQRAIDRDACNRAGAARDAIESAQRLAGLSTQLQRFAAANSVPLRATHNDTKITNVLFDARSGEAVCVVDLDTVMPGLTLYDVGEMIRTACTQAHEDERDPSRVTVDEPMLAAVLRGFFEGAGDVLSECEREFCVRAGRVLAFENGVRFLTDYLSGDVYFRVDYDAHNLDRARAQFALARALERYEDRRVSS